MKKCKNCGQLVSDEMSFCTNCGSPELTEVNANGLEKKIKKVNVKVKPSINNDLIVANNDINTTSNQARLSTEETVTQSNKGMLIGIGVIIAIFCIALIGMSQGSNKSSDTSMEAPKTQASTSNTSTSKLDDKERTREAIDPYLAYLGNYVENDTVRLSQDLNDNAKSVFVMGELGTISYKLSTETPTVNFLEWESNKSYSLSEYNSFLNKMNQFLDEDNHVMSLEGYSDETHFWSETYQNCYVICWYENNKIMVGWVYDDDTSSDYSDSNTSSSYETTTYYYRTSKQAFLCEVCGKYGTNTWEGLSGETEYYCDEHYRELIEMYGSMFGF